MKTIAEIKFEQTKAGNIPGYAIVAAHGMFYVNGYSDIIAGRGFTVRCRLTCNTAFRHLAYLITPKTV